jgi:uncharacterized protein
MSSVSPDLTAPIVPHYHPRPDGVESETCANYISSLGLVAHPEGGYFRETDRDPLKVPNPFLDNPKFSYKSGNVTASNPTDNTVRNASTTIYYYNTPKSPTGVWHRNKGRTVHTLHRGRGRYILIHADEVLDSNGRATKKARLETFIVGQNVAKGERLQWIVEGGKFKANFVLPDEDGKEESGGMLISEVSLLSSVICYTDLVDCCAWIRLR